MLFNWGSPDQSPGFIGILNWTGGAPPIPPIRVIRTHTTSLSSIRETESMSRRSRTESLVRVGEVVSLSRRRVTKSLSGDESTEQVD